MIDLLTTPNGDIQTCCKAYPKCKDHRHIPIYAVDPDLFTPFSFPLPRLCMGTFVFLLKRIYRKLFKVNLEVIQYGKPFKITFDFTSITTNFFPPSKFHQFHRRPYFDPRKKGRHNEFLYDWGQPQKRHKGWQWCWVDHYTGQNWDVPRGG